MVERTHFTCEARISAIIIEHLCVDASEVIEKASLSENLGADSLDLIDLFMAIEDEFDIEIPDNDFEKLATVGKVIEYIKNSKVSEIFYVGLLFRVSK